ncbi:MAG: SDR family oxidoreductase [Phyllobacteriaceae bacterium]|nr:SDR family oxidoreductase [Phyllobacteriaceae bacterium]
MSITSRDNLLIFGCGFSGEAIARLAAGNFAAITGTTRDAAKADRIRNAGAEPLVFDGEALSPELVSRLAGTTHLLVSIAPGEAGDPVLNALEKSEAALPALKWTGYLSTVGVYGDHGGAWVDEQTEPRPASKRSRQRLEAETAWRTFAGARGLPLAVLRLSGIYGPGRNAFVNIANGTARRLVKPGQVFNRIHRDDIAAAALAAARKKAGGIFNITDDEPAPPQDVVTFAHQLAGVAPPPETDFETADLSPMARSFYGENKRVSNAKSKAELGLAYAFPDYRTALTRMWREESWKPQ